MSQDIGMALDLH